MLYQGTVGRDVLASILLYHGPGYMHHCPYHDTCDLQYHTMNFTIVLHHYTIIPIVVVCNVVPGYNPENFALPWCRSIVPHPRSYGCYSGTVPWYSKVVFFTVVTDVVPINCTGPKIPWGLSQQYSTVVHLGGIFTMVIDVVPINCTRPKIPWGYYSGTVTGYSKVA